MSLLAATTLGISGVGQVRARISADSDLRAEHDDYRLIVQSYSKASLAGDRVPDEYARPEASAQRAVTAEELQAGIDVQMLQLGGEIGASDRVVVAWVEQGKPDLEFDALRARPGKSAFYGMAADADGGAGPAVHIVLKRQGV
jgi:hypothetical protein